MFRFAALTSPDLLHEDAQRIVTTVEHELENTLPTTTTHRDVTANQLPELEMLQPFAA